MISRDFTRGILPLALAALVCGAAAPPAKAPNDIYFSYQWALDNQADPDQIVDIDADDYHTIYQKGVAGVDIGWLAAQPELAARGTNPVTVAVIDSGVDATHPDLQGRIAPGAFDFLLNFPAVTDPYGHGTHIAGIIAANADNGIGVAGIAPPSVKVLPVRVLWPGGSPGSTAFTYPNPVQSPGQTAAVPELISDFVAQGVDYAVAHGATILNISISWPKVIDTPKARAAIQRAAQAGALVVVGAGNDRKEYPTYPCSYEGVLCVGSITNTGDLAIYSNFGGQVDLLAPGDGILSTYPASLESQVFRINGYEIMSGTSMSAPMISGVAAAIRSAIPGISLNELKARLLTSASVLPSAGAALYGLVNLPRALDATPRPVYVPDFKAIDEIPVDEPTLTAQGQISVQNLWQAATGVKIQVTANGKAAGSAQADSLASGAALNVPWKYAFASLSDSSNIQLVVQVTDAQGTSKDFTLDATAVRVSTAIPGGQSFAVPGVKPSDWLTTQDNHLAPNGLNPVESYPSQSGAQPGLPVYYRTVGAGSAGSALQIYDPSSSTPVNVIDVPGIQGVREVIRMDVKGDGNRDWVVIGLGTNPGQPVVHYEFYFLDPSFQPLFGSQAASALQAVVSFDPKSGNAYVGGIQVTRSFAADGSWIRTQLAGGNAVLPVFLANGPLPAKDGYGELDPRAGGVAEHLYYLSPLPAGTGQPTQLELRALDNATFRTQFPYARLLNVIPQTSDDRQARLKVLMANGTTLASPTLLWTIQSLTTAPTSPAPGWDALASSGIPYIALSSDPSSSLSAFLSLYDDRGNITWVSAEGSYLDRSEFQFASPENPIAGLVGAFDLGSKGRSWFMESGFDMVGYHQASGATAQEMKTLPIDRESSFSADQFSEIFTPMLLGGGQDAKDPSAAVYVDATIVRGNAVGADVWDSTTDTFVKPLRYSIQIPDQCLEMNPVQLSSDALSFALPLICSQNGTLQLSIVKPE